MAREEDKVGHVLFPGVDLGVNGLVMVSREFYQRCSG